MPLALRLTSTTVIVIETPLGEVRIWRNKEGHDARDLSIEAPAAIVIRREQQP